MKTRISEFCDEYERLLIPIDELIEDAVGRIEGESRKDLLEDPLTQLSDARHRFHSLREKIEHQQAYLIIFGPLKSGKSTLMNAISGAYVSEVTAMPAYPCLVYVSHGEKTEFSAIKYNATSQQFTDNESLREVLDESHSHLASRIRMHELEGEEFDPRVHYTEAVRRIDVRTPVPALKEANTVLVDTPGLYSRMKFGYDLITREFRNSAACAVFVVKSDNLFLDQVFDEFTDLLEEFSRIFLVVNIDSRKQDLRPDGSLGPSIESSDPERIVEAFKSLAMTAPLREAHEAGRLQIYPVDLLNAASESLNKTDDASEESFDTFLTDLAEYLNSSDYLLEFERDSLRQGAGICAEVRDACDLNASEAFQQERNELARVAEELPSKMRVIDEVSGSKTTAALERSRSQCVEAANQAAERARKDLQTQLGDALNTWMDNDESLQALRENWGGAVEKVCLSVSADLPDFLASRFGTPTGGAELDASSLMELQKIGLEVEALARPFVSNLKDLPEPTWKPLELNPDEISVRRSFFDRILFRSTQKVRERLFGPIDTPDKPIPPAVKRKRLSENGFMELHDVIDAYLKENFPGPQREYVEKHADAYIEKFSTAFDEELQSIRGRLVTLMETTTARIAADDRILESIESLNDQIATVEERIAAMEENCEEQESPAECSGDEEVSADTDVTESGTETGPEEVPSIEDYPELETDFIISERWNGDSE